MKYLVPVLLVALFLSVGASCKNKKTNQTEAHSVFLVRHAEKADDGTKDPPLTSQGIRRAESLADLLKYEKITRVYSTDFIRTKETAKPLAHRSEIDVEIYDPSDQQFARKIKNELKDHNILIVGHSNSTPELVNQIIGTDTYESIDESVYSKLFVIHQKGGKYEALEKSY